MGLRDRLGDLVVNIVAQLTWVVLVGISTVVLVLLFGTSDPGEAIRAEYSVPAWVIVLVASLTIFASLISRRFAKPTRVLRGRLRATQSNVELIRRRSQVALPERVIRSTRFGRWPAAEVLQHRSNFRQELEHAVMEENCDVRRIWNLSSLDDVQRLRDISARYAGNAGHSIRVYVMLPDHALPELLVVDGVGASMSFSSTRTPHELDWAVHYRRQDLISAIRDLFDVLWDRAERVFDSGVMTPHGRRLLEQLEETFRAQASGSTNVQASEDDPWNAIRPPTS